MFRGAELPESHKVIQNHGMDAKPVLDYAGTKTKQPTRWKRDRIVMWMLAIVGLMLLVCILSLFPWR
jgi:hypothetical protein